MSSKRSTGVVLIVVAGVLIAVMGSGCSHNASQTAISPRQALTGHPPTADELKQYMAKYPNFHINTPGGNIAKPPGQ